MKYRRILLKLSGESLGGETGAGFSVEVLESYSKQIARLTAGGVQVVIVVGGGNIFRGIQGLGRGIDRVHGDQMGMLATVINSLGLQSALETVGVPVVVMTAMNMSPIAEHYRKELALKHLSKGRVLIVAGGTGNPYFTTDSAAALRGVELECDALLKGTRVDGIYTADPERDKTAERFDELTFDEAYTRGLKIMDLTAFTLCRENNLPIVVFKMDTEGTLLKVVKGEKIGTLVK